MRPYEIRQCADTICNFRFPVAESDLAGIHCPHCGKPTGLVSKPQTNVHPPAQATPRFSNLVLLLDNIRSLYNVGAIVRTADGAGIKHLHLGGITAPPTHPKLSKTALGAEESIPWTQHKNSLQAAEKLKAAGYAIWALERNLKAENLFDATFETKLGQQILFVVGNEKVGVDPEILQQADRIFSLPMLGKKGSLNVAVAFGIAIYHIQFG